MAVSGTAVAAIAAGGVFVYAGLKGVSIPQAVQAIVQGRSPASLSQANPITLPTGGGGADADFGGNPSKSSGGKTPVPDLPHTGNSSNATPPTVGSNPLPRLPVVAPPRATAPTPQTVVTAPPKKSSTWWKPWTWW